MRAFHASRLVTEGTSGPGEPGRERMDAARVGLGVLYSEERTRDRENGKLWNLILGRVNDQGHRLVTMHPAAFLRAILQVSASIARLADAP